MREECNPVNRPRHHTGTKIEVINDTKTGKFTYCLQDVVNYISRSGKRHIGKEIEDLRAAQWYLNRRIFELEAMAKITTRTDATNQKIAINETDMPCLAETQGNKTLTVASLLKRDTATPPVADGSDNQDFLRCQACREVVGENDLGGEPDNFCSNCGQRFM